MHGEYSEVNQQNIVEDHCRRGEGKVWADLRIGV